MNGKRGGSDNILGKIVPSKGGAPAPKKTKSKKSKPAKARSGKKLSFRIKSRKLRIAIFCTKILSMLIAVGFIGGFFLVAIYGHDLPDVDKLYDEKLRPSVTVLDKNGDILANYGDLYTEFVQYKDIPKNLVNAVVATEDRRFFSHWGVDPRGMARAMVTNLIRGHVAQGGSTVTQQLAKVIFLKPERNMKRKIQEAMLAVWLEHKFSKEQIMAMYLNRVYLGAGAYGIDAASRKYFDKPAKDLSLYECAMIAGLLKAPTTYSPLNSPKASVDRTKQVLFNMVDAEKISEYDKNRALQSAAKIQIHQQRESGKYFADYIADQVQQYIGKTPDNIVIKTTYDPDLQKYADDALTQNILASGKDLNVSQAAIVVMSPRGEVLAMVGGADYSDSQFNRVTQAQRQPGSLFKLFVYAAAMENGYDPDSEIEDSPIKIGKWQPTNYDGSYAGVVTLRTALMKSLNAATVRLAEDVGIEKIISLAHQMGIKSSLNNMPSTMLGASEVNLLEITSAYAVLPNKGRAVEPYSIREIKTTNGEVLYKREGEYDLEVLDEETVKKMNDMLMNVIAGGTARGANIGRDAAGKTGTNQDYKDAWFVGYTPQLVAGVWVGNDNNRQMKKVTGGSLPARIWKDFMKAALEKAPAQTIDTNYSKGIGDDIQNFWDEVTGE
jgi:penicillin-binding protein 1A